MKKALLGQILVWLIFLFACSDEHDLYHHETAVLFSVRGTQVTPLAAPSITVNISCDNVFGTGISGDWTQSNKTVTSSISLPQGKTCRLTVTNFFDGSSNYTPVASSMVIIVSASGSVTTTTSFQYTTSGAVKQWLLAMQGASAYTIFLSYAPEALSATTSVTPTVISLQSMSETLTQVVAPTVTDVTLTETKILLITYDTLTANVSNSTGCKYIDNSGTSPTYNAASWTSVNSAYNNGSATTCPVMIPGSPLLLLGNWTSLWKPGIKTLVMWANTLNGVTAYTTAMVGP